ncbi:MAG: hypothetical protein LIO77_06590, partial [Rikenellaceae bacterium]|nr:hypothetical protein [Rikenellaceae bacterium]
MLWTSKYSFILLMFVCCVSSCNRSTRLDNIGETERVNSCEDSLFTEDKFFMQAYSELIDMLENKTPFDLKRAVFLPEWAYMEGNLNYLDYCSQIERTGQSLKRFIKSKGVESYRTSGNYALFEYFTQSSWMNDNQPFTYDFEDFAGRENKEKTFVTKVMRTHSGQCRSLPLYYLILAEEIGASAHLALAPNHSYIKHLDENNNWVNVELTNGHLSTDAWIISSMAVSAESIRNRVYMDALTIEETVAHLLVFLGECYESKYSPDRFSIQCYDKSLEYYPHSMSALMSKNNAILQHYFNFQEQQGL